MKKTSIIFFFLTFIFIGGRAQSFENYNKKIDTTIVSEALGYGKKVTIRLPYEWQEDTHYKFPLIIIFDSQNKRMHNYMLQSIDHLTMNDLMPSAIIISIESQNSLRYPETLHKASSSKGKLIENEQFLFDELIPFAEKELQASKFRLFIGYSRYGYFTTSLLASHSNDLNAVISLSPFFEQKNVNLVDSVIPLQKAQFNSTRYYRYAIGNDYPADFQKMENGLKNNSNKNFDAKGYFFTEAGHNSTPGLAINNALYEIFEFWTKQQNTYFDKSNKKVEIITGLNDNIKEHYGYNLKFSIGVLNGKGWYFFNESMYEKAIAAWEQLVLYYPNFSMGYFYIINAQKQLNIDSKKTVELLKLSLEKSKLFSDSEKEELLNELKK